MQDKINIKVVYATASEQRLLNVRMPAGVSIRQALLYPGVAEYFPEVDPHRVAVGVYGELVADDYRVQDGDRLEMYRPLESDPRDRRRLLAASGKTIDQKEGGIG
jgi:putative ubiquitin-RnfH superfamily antitoxin RatB of RatAB toxin-antitoxin module